MSDRLLKICSDLTGYNLMGHYLPGVRQVICDALSQHPWLPAKESARSPMEMKCAMEVCNVTYQVDSEEVNHDVWLVEMEKDAKKDMNYQMLFKEMLNDTSAEDLKKLPKTQPTRQMIKFWNRLSFVGNQGGKVAVLDASRLIPPEAVRERIL